MWIPTHYAVLYAVLLLGESAILFIYTIIGLIRQNPMPYLFPPVLPEYPLCQQPYIPATSPQQQPPLIYREGVPSFDDNSSPDPQQQTAAAVTVTQTSFIRQMLSTASNGAVYTLEIEDGAFGSPATTATLGSGVALSTTAATPGSTFTGAKSSETASGGSSSTKSSSESSSGTSSSREGGNGGLATNVVLLTSTLDAKGEPAKTATSVVVHTV